MNKKFKLENLLYDLDGNSLTADNDGEGSDHEDGQVYAIYNDDKQSLLVRQKVLDKKNQYTFFRYGNKS